MDSARLHGDSLCNFSDRQYGGDVCALWPQHTHTHTRHHHIQQTQ